MLVLSWVKIVYKCQRIRERLIKNSIALFIVNVCNGVSSNRIIPVVEDCLDMRFVRDGRRQAVLLHVHEGFV